MARDIKFSVPDDVASIVESEMVQVGFSGTMSSYVKHLLCKKYGIDEEYERSRRASNRTYLSEGCAESLADLEIIQLYNKGYSLKEIMIALKKKGLVSPLGKTWTNTRIMSRITGLKNAYFAELLENANILQTHKS